MEGPDDAEQELRDLIVRYTMQFVEARKLAAETGGPILLPEVPETELQSLAFTIFLKEVVGELPEDVVVRFRSGNDP